MAAIVPYTSALPGNPAVIPSVRVVMLTGVLAVLPVATASAVTRLHDGDTLDLTATLVRRTIKGGGRAFVMYGFNGQIPGPLIRVPQNATITVRFHNRIDLPSSVHWHGVRLDNRS